MPGYPLADAVALWPMNLLRGIDIRDLSGNNNHGIFAAADPPRWINDYINFDAGVERIVVPHSNTIDFDTEGFFVTVCFRTTSVDYQYIVNKNYGGAGVEWYAIVMLTTGRVAFQIDDGAVLVNATSTVIVSNDGEWHIATGIRNTNTGNVELYIDGIICNIAPPDIAGSIANNGNLFIGCRADLLVTRDFTGDIRFVNIHHYVPQPSKVALSHQEPYCMYPENIMPEFGIVA